MAWLMVLFVDYRYVRQGILSPSWTGYDFDGMKLGWFDFEGCHPRFRVAASRLLVGIISSLDVT